MDATTWLTGLLLGGLMGLLGQGARAVVGMKKLNDDAVAKGEALRDNFSPSQFFLSLMIGFIAGALAMAGLISSGQSPNNIGGQALMTVLAAGYAGADFIEGFVNRNIPKPGTAAPAAGVTAMGAEPPAYG